MIRGYTTKSLQTSSIVTEAKNYYACPSLTSFPIFENQLDDQGEDRIFFDQTLITTDLMNKNKFPFFAVPTTFDIALLMDTGFY